MFGTCEEFSKCLGAEKVIDTGCDCCPANLCVMGEGEPEELTGDGETSLYSGDFL